MTAPDPAVPAAHPRIAAHLCETVSEIVTGVLPSLDGACLGASAMLARALSDLGVPCVAVYGTYRGRAHWWVHTQTLRLDATRHQFEPRPLVTPVADQGVYAVERTFPPRWTHEQAVQEFARMFADPAAGLLLGRRVLDQVTAAAHAAVSARPRPSVKPAMTATPTTPAATTLSSIEDLRPIADPDNGDLVITVPQGMWAAWLSEGELPENPGVGAYDEYHYTIGRRPGEWVKPGARVYVVAFGRLRGYAPLVSVEPWDAKRWSLVRKGGAVACTIPVEIPGFRGIRRRFWDRALETPFPDYQTAGVR